MSQKTVKFPGGAEIDLDPAVAALVEAQIVRADAAETEAARLKGEVAAVTKQLEAVRADSSDSAVETRVKAALDVMQFAQANHVPVTDAAGKFLSVDDVKRAVFAKSCRADSIDAELKAATGVELDAYYNAAKRLLTANPARHQAYDVLKAAEAGAGVRRADAANGGTANVEARLAELRAKEQAIAVSQNQPATTAAN